jgi:hypothetical protein
MRTLPAGDVDALSGKMTRWVSARRFPVSASRWDTCDVPQRTEDVYAGSGLARRCPHRLARRGML